MLTGHGVALYTGRHWQQSDPKDVSTFIGRNDWIRVDAIQGLM